MRAPQERTWFTQQARDYGKIHWAYRLGELLCDKGQWHPSIVPRPQRPQPGHQVPAPLHPNIMWCTSTLNGAKYFSMTDARSGYWNIKLSHSSSFYTTFNNLPHGRYTVPMAAPSPDSCRQDQGSHLISQLITMPWQHKASNHPSWLIVTWPVIQPCSKRKAPLNI